MRPRTHEDRPCSSRSGPACGEETSTASIGSAPACRTPGARLSLLACESVRIVALPAPFGEMRAFTSLTNTGEVHYTPATFSGHVVPSRRRSLPVMGLCLVGGTCSVEDE